MHFIDPDRAYRAGLPDTHVVLACCNACADSLANGGGILPGHPYCNMEAFVHGTQDHAIFGDGEWLAPCDTCEGYSKDATLAELATSRPVLFYAHLIVEWTADGTTFFCGTETFAPAGTPIHVLYPEQDDVVVQSKHGFARVQNTAIVPLR